MIRQTSFVLTLSLITMAGTMTGCGKLKSALRGGDAGADGGLLVSGGGGDPVPVPALSAFEGEIGMMMVGVKSGKAETPVNLSLLVKSEKVRVNVPSELAKGSHPLGGSGEKNWGLLNTPEKKLYFVSDDQKQAIVIDLNKAGEQFKSFGKGLGGGSTGAKGPAATPPKVTKTGRMSKVAGYSCEDWEIADDKNDKVAVCIADQNTSWLRFPSVLPGELSWAAELLDGKHFPLRAIAFQKDGKESGRIEVTKLEKKSLEPSLFEVPATYKQIDMAQMFQRALPKVPSIAAPPPRK